MWELRWVLLGLGCLLIAGIYGWGRFSARRRARDSRPGGRLSSDRKRAEPTISVDEVPDESANAQPSIEPHVEANDVVAAEGEAAAPPVARSPESAAARPDDGRLDAKPEVKPELAARESLSADAPDRVIALRFVARDEAFNTQQAILALRELGMQHGRYGIFHRIPEGEDERAGFSVANLTEPGSFDLASAAESTLPGMTFFMVLPGVGDPVMRFDDMVSTARALGEKLDAELLDDRGSSWSIQRERYLREEIILYRHQHGFGALGG